MTKFFRCSDPSQKCPLSVDRMVVRESPAFACPCKNDRCSFNREYVGIWEVLTLGHRKWFVWGGGFVALLLATIFLLRDNDPSAKVIAELRSRVVPLVNELDDLELKRSKAGNGNGLLPDPKPLETVVEKLESKASVGLESKDSVAVTEAIRDISTHVPSIRSMVESLDSPVQGAGVVAAEARSLGAKFGRFRVDAETALEPISVDSGVSRTASDAFLSEIDGYQARLRRIAASGGAAASSAEKQNVRQGLSQLLSRLQSTQEKLMSFAPPQAAPFKSEDANLIIAVSGSLAADLVTPLSAAWSNGAVRPSVDGSFFLSSGDGRKIIVKTVASSEGFRMLAANECGVFFTDGTETTYKSSEGQGGSSPVESRSVAEVVALDAVTLLVHPDNPASTFTVGSNFGLRVGGGPKGSSLRSKAEHFRIPLDAISEASGEEAALSDQDLLSLGFYHNEGANLRAKRLAVRSSDGSVPLKPSPFTIATEDYQYSFRVTAWTSPKPSDLALAMVKYATSDAGQDVVEKRGFVSLRLTEGQADVPPEVRAALGAAIGTGTISAASRLSTNFRFAVNAASLDLKAQADMERLPRYVSEKFPTHKVVILGFTDSDGGPGINVPLSIKRADTVVSEIRRSNVDAYAAGLGEAFPVDTNATELGKARNRRAEIWVVKP
jgi:outer membrane protein OmpA-like peptidoglycan-associated protein